MEGLWLLVRAFSDDKHTAWKMDDIVEVRPPDFIGWGRLETLPRFYRIFIEDLDYRKYKTLLEEQDVDDTGLIDYEELPIIKYNRVRKYRIDISTMASIIKDQLQNTGIILTNVNQMKNHIKDNNDNTIDLDAKLIL